MFIFFGIGNKHLLFQTHAILYYPKNQVKAKEIRISVRMVKYVNELLYFNSADEKKLYSNW
jgi:hypothetical protein